jgi:hypothetical protein
VIEISKAPAHAAPGNTGVLVGDVAEPDHPRRLLRPGRQ